MSRKVPVNAEARHLQKYVGEEEEVSPALLLAGTQSHQKLEINVGGLCLYPVFMSVG